MSHTPGPWHQNELSSRAIMGPNGELVGDVLASRCDEDLRLISAAPDLETACKRALADHAEYGCITGDTLAMLRAAVEKAGGG